MKVICAGMSKCGTKSMHSALEELGFEVHDFPEAYDNFVSKYLNIYSRGWTSREFQVMYNDVDAVVDSPAYYYWEELMEAFPEAKVILMTRDTEEMWFESIRKQLLSFNGLHCYYYQLLSPTWRRFWEFARACNVAFGLEQYNFMYFGEKDPPKLPFMLAYKKHNAHVTQSCPKDRLLIYNCKSGWKPLCKFLGKDVPRKDFPWINKKSELANMIWEMPMFKKAKIEMLTNATLLFASVICAGYYFVKYS
uniref:uncharacterized protein LOC120332880 n=1 Tax=Styela clava TaxID=7725 RepID=UPI0019399A12|nr:uncharacterized protein LOC120332880 [Styela clava]